MILNKYAAALLQLAIVLGTAFVAIPVEKLSDPATVSQLILLALSSVLVYFLPLLRGPWAAGLKTGVGVLIAIATAVTPFWINGQITGQQIVVVVLAALSALATELGVQMRSDMVLKTANEEGVYDITQAQNDIRGTEKALGRHALIE